MVSVTLLGIAQDGGVPQSGCSCCRCLAVHEGISPELYPVSLGIQDDDGKFHLIEASRTLSRQLFLWSKSIQDSSETFKMIGPLSSVAITHSHLGHIDGIGQFGKEVMGFSRESIRLLASKSVMKILKHKTNLEPFLQEEISNCTTSRVNLGTNVSLEFIRVPHRDEEGSDMHAIIVSGRRRLLFLPDHDTYVQTLGFHKMTSLREWFQSLSVDVVLLDGTFFSFDEVAKKRSDYTGIPHPPVEQSLQILGCRQESDPEIVFIHLNHSNPLIDDMEKRNEVEHLGWKIGRQGQVWEV